MPESNSTSAVKGRDEPTCLETPIGHPGMPDRNRLCRPLLLLLAQPDPIDLQTAAAHPNHPRSNGDGLREGRDCYRKRRRTRNIGWLLGFPHGKSSNAPTFLYLHGQDATIGKNLEHTQRLHQMGFNVLLIDYRGFGESFGKQQPSERQGL